MPASERRQFTIFDTACMQFDKALRTVFGQPRVAERARPDVDLPTKDLTEKERRLSGRLMRVNHTGEVCAQALYQGQALCAHDRKTQKQLKKAADEETDHLAWCEARLDELQAHRSYLNPLWYLSSYTIGALAGLAGDRWSLGFLEETEHQVSAHLQHHLTQLPPNDEKSRVIVKQMQQDEVQHAKTAHHAGAAALPWIVKKGMTVASKCMTMCASLI